MNQKIVSIQYLRAYAAISVLLFHAADRFFLKAYNWPIEIFDFGKYGVDIFFVISGFIMGLSMENRPSHEIFFKNRLARIYPLYFFVIALSFFIKKLFGVNSFNSVETFDFTLFTFFDSKGTINHVSVAWTLYYEMFFYFCCAMSLWLFKDYKKGIFTLFLIVIISPESLPFVGLNTGLLSMLLAGFYFYEIYKDFKFYKAAILAICLTKIFLSFDNGFNRIIAINSAIFFILLLDKINFSENKILKTLGDSSYSIYLLHVALIELFCKLALKTSSSIFLINLLWASVGICVIVGLSVLNYELFEKPVTKRLKRYF
jgi:exopolysaccharide production protein ExoZ